MTVQTPDNNTPTALPQAEPTLAQQKEGSPQAQQKAPEAVPAQQPEAPEDPNWRAFREARKKDRTEREAAEKRAIEKEAEIAALKAAMEAAFTKNPPTQQYQQGYQQDQGFTPEESEDQRIEKKVQAALAARETQYQQQQYQREQQEYPNRLRQSYPDFEQAIDSHNLDYLEYHYPEVAAPLKMLPDGYDKWNYIYKAVKKFVPNQSSSRQDAAKAQANMMKPKSMSSPTITQPGEVKGSAALSEERKAANWARMQGQLRGVG